MEGVRLILNDQTIIENGSAGYSAGSLWLYFTGYTMMEIAQIFCDPGKTSHIVFQYGEMQDTYDGFTSCINMSIDIDGNASGCLVKPTQCEV